MFKTFKIFALMNLVIFITGLLAFGQQDNVKSLKIEDVVKMVVASDLKVLAQGNYSKVDIPFIFVARDEPAYNQLRTLVEELPDSSLIDFTKNVVVAGFAGEKPTGGWSVEIREVVTKILVDINPPRKDVSVTQVITTPFKVSLIPIDENKALPLNFSGSFTNNLQNFNVTKSEFSYSGGFAGIRKTFAVNGKVKLMKYGNFLTVWFELSESAKEIKRTLFDVASGSIIDSNIKISKLTTGNFVDKPHPQFTIFGTLKGKSMNLNFQSLPTVVADGYQGVGSLIAESVE